MSSLNDCNRPCLRTYVWGWKTLEPGTMLLLLLSRFSRVRLCATLCTAAHQALLSLGFSRQEYWSGEPFPSPTRYYGQY